MKEATGELNSTLFAVISIAILSAFFFTMIWPMIRTNMTINMKCGDAICPKDDDGDGWVTCAYYTWDKNSNTYTLSDTALKCPYKG